MSCYLSLEAHLLTVKDKENLFLSCRKGESLLTCKETGRLLPSKIAFLPSPESLAFYLWSLGLCDLWKRSLHGPKDSSDLHVFSQSCYSIRSWNCGGGDVSVSREGPCIYTKPSREGALSERKRSLHNVHQPGEMGTLYRAKASYEKHPWDTLC